MEIPHASFAQVSRGKDGNRVLITEDVGDIAKRLKEVDGNLILVWNERGEYFMVIEKLENGSESIVTTVPELRPDLIEYVRMLGSEDYDVGKEADRIDKEAERQKDHAFSEKIGARGERLAHALHKDLSHKNRIIVP